jgi:hypothetical protein
MRKVQNIVQKDQDLTNDKKFLSRIVGKSFLKDLKQATLGILVDNGILRDLKTTDMEYVLIPILV